MVMNFGLVAVGLVLLMFAGDALVRGAVSLALKLGIPALIVSLTIVAFGTSAPELLVAVQSAIEGAPGIAFGNVVGSNVANVLLVLGVPAIISGLQVQDNESRRSYFIMFGVSLIFIAMCFWGVFFWIQGTILLALLAWMIFDAISKSRAKRCVEVDPSEVNEDDVHLSGVKVGGLLLAGMIGLPLGAHLLIEGAVAIAQAWGLSEAIIGLTIVAVGTSLPELATTTIAALKRQADVAFGNVIGSNIFNILAIMGVASFFGPLSVPPELLRFDLWIMLGCALILAPFVLRGVRMGRTVGIVLTGAYIVYVVSLLL